MCQHLQGKAKDSGWGSDDEAAGLPTAEVDEDVEPEPTPKKPVRKPPASAFDLLQGSDEEAEQPTKGAASYSAFDDNNKSAAANGAATDEDSTADSDEDSEPDEQVRF